jgi:hypothetical protein
MKWHHRKRCCTSSTKRFSWKYTHKGSASDRSFWIIIKTMEDIRKTITDVGGVKTPWRKTDRYKSR